MKKTSLTLNLKQKIKNEINRNGEKDGIISKYKICETTYYDIKQDKSYDPEFSTNINSKLKRRKTGKYEEINNATLNFITKCNEDCIPIAKSNVQTFALDFASKNNFSDFKASNGWFRRLSFKYNVKRFKISGESNSADKTAAINYINTTTVFERFDAKDIYNFDESGLYYDSLPDHTLNFKKSKNHGLKKNLKRLTCGFMVSCAGEKKPPIIIGKAAKPRSFKNKNLDGLRMSYYNQKNSWMDRNLFGEYMKTWNKELRKNKRRVLVILDNFSGHQIEELSNIEFSFLPPNTTSEIQPLDLGIIASFKKIYKKMFLQNFINNFSATKDKKKCKIDLFEAMELISIAWENVSKDTILNCWKK